MSFISRLLQRFRPIRYVGRDLIGNRFYEHPSSSNDPRRTKRTVQYKNPEDVWQYIGGGKRLAVQWSSWLSHTRPHPPTLEELEIDVARQRHVQANVALIEARDREERAQMLAMQQQQSAPAALERPQDPVTVPETPEEPNVHAGATPEARAAPSTPKSTLPNMNTNTDMYEPESWTPLARPRRG